MSLANELVGVANDYISGRIKLGRVNEFIHERVDEFVELDKSGRPEALLSGFIQIRIYEMDHGLTEDDIRRDIGDYLAEHNLLRPPVERLATG